MEPCRASTRRKRPQSSARSRCASGGAPSTRLPAGLAAYREVPPEQLPRTESLADTIARAVPYFRAEIAPALSAGKRVLVAAHGNSLRALVMHLEGLSPEAIAGVNLPTGVPLVYELREDFSVADRRYLGDPAAVQAKMNAVANQGKAQPGPAPARPRP